MPPTKSKDYLFVQSVIGRSNAHAWHKMYLDEVPIMYKGRTLTRHRSTEDLYLFDFIIQDSRFPVGVRLHSDDLGDLGLTRNKKRSRSCVWFVLAYFLSDPYFDKEGCFILDIDVKEVLGIITAKEQTAVPLSME